MDLPTRFPTWSALILVPLLIFGFSFNAIRQSEDPVRLGLIVLGVAVICAAPAWGLLVLLDKRR